MQHPRDRHKAAVALIGAGVLWYLYKHQPAPAASATTTTTTTTAPNGGIWPAPAPGVPAFVPAPVSTPPAPVSYPWPCGNGGST